MDTASFPPPIVPALPPHPSNNDRLLAILCHLSGLIGVPLLLPFVVYLVMKEDSAFVKDHAREALNFHLSIIIYTLLCVPLVMIVVGVVFLVALGIFSLVVAIIAAMKASDCAGYRYPLCIRLLK
jgi:uncharacterized Tic20 family protein